MDASLTWSCFLSSSHSLYCPFPAIPASARRGNGESESLAPGSYTAWARPIISLALSFFLCEMEILYHVCLPHAVRRANKKMPRKAPRTSQSTLQTEGIVIKQSCNPRTQNRLRWLPSCQEFRCTLSVIYPVELSYILPIWSMGMIPDDT